MQLTKYFRAAQLLFVMPLLMGLSGCAGVGGGDTGGTGKPRNENFTCYVGQFSVDDTTYSIPATSGYLPGNQAAAKSFAIMVWNDHFFQAGDQVQIQGHGISESYVKTSQVFTLFDNQGHLNEAAVDAAVQDVNDQINQAEAADHQVVHPADQGILTFDYLRMRQ